MDVFIQVTPSRPQAGLPLPASLRQKRNRIQEGE